ncbi:MAG: TlpA family protein disulfide reductase [Gemmatimonadaceae bacterium]
MTETPTASPPPLRRWRRWLTPWNVFTLIVVLGVGPQLLPHLGALVGIESGDHDRPAFSATTLEGVPVSDSTLRGRVVLVNFWATWCLPCRAEMPMLEAMAQRHAPAGLVVLGLSVDRSGPEAVTNFLRERGITYPVAIVGRDVETAFGGVQGYPTSVLLDRTGRVRYKVVGPLAMASLEPAVRRLLRDTVTASP